MEVNHSRNRPVVERLTVCSLLLIACTAAQAETFSVLSQNMNRLFDDIDDGNQEQVLSSKHFRDRIDRAVDKIADDFALPQVIALQEVENLNVLQQIADGIHRRHAIDYRAILHPGQDISAINLGFLVQSSVTIRKSQQLFREQRLKSTASPLFSRPPLLLDACYRNRCLSLINLHLRSMRGIDSADEGKRVARKRLQQAQTLARWINQQQRNKPDAWLMLLGDFNALTPADRHVDVAGIIRGSPDNSRTRLVSADLVDPDLVDLTRQIPRHRRYSYIFRQRKQQLDYIYVNQPLAAVRSSVEFGRIDYAFSDHAGLLARFHWSN